MTARGALHCGCHVVVFTQSDTRLPLAAAAAGGSGLFAGSLAAIEGCPEPGGVPPEVSHASALSWHSQLHAECLRNAEDYVAAAAAHQGVAK